MNVEFGEEEFVKAQASNHKWVHACVEVAIREDAIGVRDSKDSSKTTLCFTVEEWAAFVEGVKAGEFDL